MTLHDAEAPPAGEPTPSPRPRGMLGRRLAFREPSPEELGELLSPTTPSPGQSPAPGTEAPATEELPGEAPGFDSAGPPSDEKSSRSSEPTSSEPSDTPGGKKRAIFASEENKKLARNAVLLGSYRAQQILARTEGQIRAGLYLADDEDAENIGDPVANIVARRTGVSSDNPDVNDGIAALVGFANYVAKQFTRAMVAKRWDAEASAPQVIPGEVAG